MLNLYFQHLWTLRDWRRNRPEKSLYKQPKVVKCWHLWTMGDSYHLHLEYIHSRHWYISKSKCCCYSLHQHRSWAWVTPFVTQSVKIKSHQKSSNLASRVTVWKDFIIIGHILKIWTHRIIGRLFPSSKKCGSLEENHLNNNRRTMLVV